MKNNETSTPTSRMNTTTRNVVDEDDGDFTKGAFLFTAILSFLGNLLVLILFIRNTKWLKKAYGRFILALAIVDILTAICLFAMPLAIHEMEFMTNPKTEFAREMYCRLVWSHYILFSFGVTSVYTCLVLTIERWIAVAKPFYVRKYNPSQMSLFGLLAFPWFAGFLLEANVISETGVKNFQDGTFTCTWSDSGKQGRPRSITLTVLSFLGAMLIPATLIVVMYAHILIKLRHENCQRQSPGMIAQPDTPTSSSSSSFYKLAFRRATKMAACATIAVILCWFPCQTYALMAQLGYAEQESTLHRMLNLLAFFNSCLNPFIYTFSNALFRKPFMETFTSFQCQSTSPTDNLSVFV